MRRRIVLGMGSVRLHPDPGFQVVHFSFQLGQFLVEAREAAADGGVEGVQEVGDSLQRA